MKAPRVTLGATCLGSQRCHILAWAPRVGRMEVVLFWGNLQEGLHNTFDGAGVSREYPQRG
jgi:hypothetical protein